MAIAFGAIGAKEITGTTTSAVAYPASVGAGDMALVGRCAWTAANADLQPSAGWTQAGTNDGGTGSSVDAHTTDVGCSYKEMAGGETGTVSFNNGASAGGTVAVMTRYTKGGGESWVTPVFASGDDATHAANRSVTATSSIALAPGDVVVCVVATDTDAALTITAPAITAAGITFGTTTRRSPASAGNTAGTDGNIEIFDATVTSGSGTVAPTLAFTTATSQCGPVAFVRLRVTTSGTSHAITASGSTTTDGAAALLATRVLSGAGSTTTDGAAAPRATLVMSASGSTTTSGSAALVLGNPVTASGSATTSGAAALVRTAPLTAAGSTTTTGAAALVTTVRLTASGSTTTNGAAAILTTTRLAATGTATAGGSAALTFNATLTASGSVTTGGTAAPDLVTPGGTSHALTGSGAVTTTGAASIVRRAVMSAAGSTTTDGTAAPRIRAVITATGAVTTDGIAQPRARRSLTGAGLVTTLGQATLAALIRLVGSGTVTTSGSAALTVGGPSAPLEPAPPERTRVLNIGPRHRVLEQTARDRLAQAQDRLGVLPPQNRSGTL